VAFVLDGVAFAEVIDVDVDWMTWARCAFVLSCVQI
jgi:hypothetical protein